MRIEAADDLGRERLCPYGARPPFSLERFRKLPGGRIGYRIKKARGGRAKLLVVTPLELLARIAALIPPPRYPLVPTTACSRRAHRGERQRFRVRSKSR